VAMPVTTPTHWLLLRGAGHSAAGAPPGETQSQSDAA